MDTRQLLNQFLGQADTSTGTPAGSDITGMLNRVAGNIPGGLAGGAMAGGIMALLVSNKSARKFLGKAAGYGGAAMLGGLAYRAMSNWKAGNGSASAGTTADDAGHFVERLEQLPDHNLTLVKAMIAAAMADGHIDSSEQQRIFDTVEQMQLSSVEKGMVFDLLRRPVPIEELVSAVTGLEQKTEIYLASCLAMNPDHPDEETYLHKLAVALELPQELVAEIQSQARHATV